MGFVLECNSGDFGKGPEHLKDKEGTSELSPCHVRLIEVSAYKPERHSSPTSSMAGSLSFAVDPQDCENIRLYHQNHPVYGVLFWTLKL